MSTPPGKQVRLILVFAFMMSIVVHGVLVLIMPIQSAAPGATDNFPGICYTLAAAGLLTSFYWATVKMPAATDSLRFQTEMILALAFAEVCSIAGLLLFFLHHQRSDFWPFGIGSLLVTGLFILPRAVQRD